MAHYNYTQTTPDAYTGKTEHTMKKTFLNIFLISLSLIAMSGCGEDLIDGGGDTPNYVEGGTEAAPTPISLDLQNRIGENSYYNYYQYDALADETLKLDMILENAILPYKEKECQESGDSYVKVYDSDMNLLSGLRTCTKYMTVTFPAGGRYIFQFKYPGNKGYFTADSSEQ
jgi:hypothetical protein